MASMIDNKSDMDVQDIISKHDYDKVISNMNKNDYANDLNKMMCHYINNVLINYFKMIKR